MLHADWLVGLLESFVYATPGGPAGFGGGSVSRSQGVRLRRGVPHLQGKLRQDRIRTGRVPPTGLDDQR